MPAEIHVMGVSQCLDQKILKEAFSMAKSKLAKANEKIAEGVVDGYKKIETGIVSGYQKIEDGVVNGFQQVTDFFVDQFLTKEGESVEEAKKRLAGEQIAREGAQDKTEASGKSDADKR